MNKILLITIIALIGMLSGAVVGMFLTFCVHWFFPIGHDFLPRMMTICAVGGAITMTFFVKNIGER